MSEFELKREGCNGAHGPLREQRFKGHSMWANADNVWVHRENADNWQDVKRAGYRKRKDSKLEKAAKKLLRHPNDEQALQQVAEWRAERLVELATDPKAGIRAAEQMLREFVGEETKPEIILHNGRLKPKENPLRDIQVHIIESEPKRPYMPLIEPADEWDDEEELGRG